MLTSSLEGTVYGFSGSATKLVVVPRSSDGHQRPGLMLLSAFFPRSGAGSCGSLLLAEHLLHCHHRLVSLLSLQFFHCGESQAFLRCGVGCAVLTPCCVGKSCSCHETHLVCFKTHLVSLLYVWSCVKPRAARSPAVCCYMSSLHGIYLRS